MANEIHGAGGIAVLAHPAFLDNFDEIDDYIEMGLDGIEVWHPSATETQRAELKKLATKNKLLMTGGTDFCGLYNRYPVSVGDIDVPDDAVTKLLGYKAKIRRMQKKAQKAAEEAAKAAENAAETAAEATAQTAETATPAAETALPAAVPAGQSAAPANVTAPALGEPVSE